MIVGGTRPLYLKRVSQSIATSLIQSYRQVVDRTFFLVNLKKLEKFLTLMPVSVESAAIGYQKLVKFARPLDFPKSVA